MQLSKQDKNLIRWIEALISGQYKQHKLAVENKQLYNSRTKCHCALGVALEVMGVPRFGEWFLFGYIPGEWPATKLFAPQAWFAKQFGAGIPPWAISHMSDRGKTFAEIAEYLLDLLSITLDDPTILWGLRRAIYKAIAQEHLTEPLILGSFKAKELIK